MPTRSRGACPRPGCYDEAAPGGGPCPRHAAEDAAAADARRPSAAARGYDQHWARIRAQFLRAHPTCIDCGEPATVPDHSPRTRAELVAAGVEHPDAWCYLEPRCAPCHSAKTAAHDGGFGNPTRPITTGGHHAR